MVQNRVPNPSPIEPPIGIEFELTRGDVGSLEAWLHNGNHEKDGDAFMAGRLTLRPEPRGKLRGVLYTDRETLILAAQNLNSGRYFEGATEHSWISGPGVDEPKPEETENPDPELETIEAIYRMLVHQFDFETIKRMNRYLMHRIESEAVEQ